MSERILKCVRVAFDLEPSEVTEDTSREDIEHWDSIGTIRLILCLEEEFGVSIEPEVARRMTSCRQIEEEIRKKGVAL